jgi:hypothetical protein
MAFIMDAEESQHDKSSSQETEDDFEEEEVV